MSAVSLLTFTQWSLVGLVFAVTFLLVLALSWERAIKRKRRRQGNWDAYRDELEHRARR